MTVSTFFVSEAALRTLKQRAQRGVKGVSSSHLSEAVAAALGFKTHAALRAALAGRATAEAQKPSNARLVQRLRQFGYAVPDDLRLLPEFEHSYSPFKTFPLRTQRSALVGLAKSDGGGCQRWPRTAPVRAVGRRELVARWCRRQSSLRAQHLSLRVRWRSAGSRQCGCDQRRRAFHPCCSQASES